MASATDTLTAINEAISIFDFYHHWKTLTLAFEMFQLVNKIRKYAGMPQMKRKEFEDGWNDTNVFAQSYEDAIDELIILVMGDW